jgi:hypothetical protein
LAYLTLLTYADLSIAPPEYIAQCELMAPRWLAAQLEYWSGWIDARLKKRYAAPFAAAPDTPPVVLGWLARIVDRELYLKRGINPDDAQTDDIKTRAEEARAEVKEAADAKDGLFELPLRASEPTATGITRGGPLMLSEVSPYTWSEVQRDLAADEGF